MYIYTIYILYTIYIITLEKKLKYYGARKQLREAAEKTTWEKESERKLES